MCVLALRGVGHDADELVLVDRQEDLVVSVPVDVGDGEGTDSSGALLVDLWEKKKNIT